MAVTVPKREDHKPFKDARDRISAIGKRLSDIARDNNPGRERGEQPSSATLREVAKLQRERQGVMVDYRIEQTQAGTAAAWKLRGTAEYKKLCADYIDLLIEEVRAIIPFAVAARTAKRNGLPAGGYLPLTPLDEKRIDELIETVRIALRLELIEEAPSEAKALMEVSP